MSISNLLISNLTRSTSLNNTAQTVQASASITAVDLGPNARPGEPLQVLYITSGKDFPDEVDAMEESFGRHQLNAGLLDLADIEGKNIVERKKNLESKIAQLHKDRRIDDATLVIVSMHGGDAPPPEDQEVRIEKVADEIQNVSNSDKDKNSTYMLSVLDHALEFDFGWLISRVRNTLGDGVPYQGQIHLVACGAKRSLELVADDGFSYVAYGGRKPVFTLDGQITCLAVVDLLGRCHRDRVEFPAPEKIAEHAASVSGATVSVKTAEQSIVFSALKSAPRPLIKTKAVYEGIETKGARVMEEKLAHGSAEAVKKTIEKFGETIWDHLSSTVIFDVVDSDRDVIEKLSLLDDYQWPLDEVDGEGNTLLHVAAELGNTSLIDFCVDAGLNINAKNKEGERPLHVAVSAGAVDAAKSLLEAGANPSLYFLFNGESYNLFHIAIGFGNNEIIKVMLESPHVEVNAGTGNGKTSALHLAAVRGNSRAVALLAAKRADLNIRDKGGNTPLHLAISSGSMKAAIALIEAGANLALANGEGLQPLMMAATKKMGQYLVSLLISHGAPINALDKSNNTPVHHAARAGELQSVKVLVNAGADLSLVNRSGQTPADLAERSERHSVAKFLYQCRPGRSTPKHRL